LFVTLPKFLVLLRYLLLTFSPNRQADVGLRLILSCQILLILCTCVRSYPLYLQAVFSAP